MFKQDFAEDFIREGERTGISIKDFIKRAYRVIAHKFNSEVTESRTFHIGLKRFHLMI